MARMTKKLVLSIATFSNECYKQALIDHYSAFFDENEKLNLSAREMKFKLLKEDSESYDSNKESINTSYLRYINKLTTEQLSLILEAHNKKKILRSPITVDAIAIELFERATNPEFI